MKWTCCAQNTHPHITWYNPLEIVECTFPRCNHKRCSSCPVVRIKGWSRPHGGIGSWTGNKYGGSENWTVSGNELEGALGNGEGNGSGDGLKWEEGHEVEGRGIVSGIGVDGTTFLKQMLGAEEHYDDGRGRGDTEGKGKELVESEVPGDAGGDGEPDAKAKGEGKDRDEIKDGDCSV